MRSLPAGCRLIHPTETTPYSTARTPAPIASQSATSVDINSPPPSRRVCLELVVPGRERPIACQLRTRPLFLLKQSPLKYVASQLRMNHAPMARHACAIGQED